MQRLSLLLLAILSLEAHSLEWDLREHTYDASMDCVSAHRWHKNLGSWTLNGSTCRPSIFFGRNGRFDYDADVSGEKVTHGYWSYTIATDGTTGVRLAFDGHGGSYYTLWLYGLSVQRSKMCTPETNRCFYFAHYTYPPSDGEGVLVVRNKQVAIKMGGAEHFLSADRSVVDELFPVFPVPATITYRRVLERSGPRYDLLDYSPKPLELGAAFRNLKGTFKFDKSSTVPVLHFVPDCHPEKSFRLHFSKLESATALRTRISDLEDIGRTTTGWLTGDLRQTDGEEQIYVLRIAYKAEELENIQLLQEEGTFELESDGLNVKFTDSQKNCYRISFLEDEGPKIAETIRKHEKYDLTAYGSVTGLLDGKKDLQSVAASKIVIYRGGER